MSTAVHVPVELDEKIKNILDKYEDKTGIRPNKSKVVKKAIRDFELDI